MAPAIGGVARLLDVVLPHGGLVMVMFEGYFDESGDLEDGPKVFCISGYFLTCDSAKAMDAEWGKVLDDHYIPYFHMVDCAHGNGVFEGKSDEERSEIVRKLIGLIKKHTLEGFSVLVRGEDFEPAGGVDAYSHCVSACVAALQMFIKFGRVRGEIAYFFESGHKNKGRAYNHVAEQIKKLSAPLTFAPKEQVRLLQAGDLLAWQSAKYLKDQLSKKRPPRKDFLSLMEHDHSFCHVVNNKNEKSLGFEIWPLSKRSAKSTSLSIDTDGPITILREKGDDIPIVPISEPIGFRMGGGRMAYVAFKDTGDKIFALGFDEPRLFEAIWFLAGAAGLYADHVPVLPAADAFIAHGLLHVKTAGGATMAFHLSEDGLERLRVALAKVSSQGQSS